MVPSGQNFGRHGHAAVWIRAERGALVAAWLVDRRAGRCQRAGIPIGCAEFVSMAMTPMLEPSRPAPPPSPYRQGPDPDSLREVLVRAYGAGGFPAVAEAAHQGISALEPAPEYQCMTRHLLESIRRVARLAPAHAAAVEIRDLPSPVGLSELLLRLHLAALPAGADLDRDAAPLQEAGIPILCRDVPPVPDP